MYDRDLSHYRALAEDEEPALRPVSLGITPDEIADEIDRPFESWAKDCHTVSLQIVKSAVLPRLGYPVRRVARGSTAGVLGQHSWIVLGPDPYEPTVPIVDPTLWSYRGDVDGIYFGHRAEYRHMPHGGAGTIWGYGRPPEPVRKIMELPPETLARLSPSARHFLKICGPLDWAGWSFLTQAPVRGWPAVEIITAMAAIPQFAVIIPVDRLGMLTDQNPGGLYLPADYPKKDHDE